MHITQVPSQRKLAQAALFAAFALIPRPQVFAEHLPSEPPVELVRRTVRNELNAGNADKYMFMDYKQTPHGSQTKLMVETRDAMAGLIIANNGRPLGPEERKAELARVERFVQSPDELRKKQRQEKENADRVGRIMKALPDAFLYEYDGEQMGQSGIGKPGEPLLRLKFRPNPNYDPPSRVEQVLTGMQGYVLIDPRRDRIAMIDGQLAEQVSFGWGILGHLDKGGHFVVEQGDIGDDHWEITHMNLSFTGKILLFKSITIQSQEVSSHFQKVSPNLTFAQGLDLLKKQQALLAENGLPDPK